MFGRTTKLLCRWRFAVVFGAAFLVVLTISSAALATWGWQGSVGIGSGNGQCYWYPGQSACGPSTAGWQYINAENALGGTVLAGFESTSAIRGSYINQNETIRVYQSSLGFGLAQTQGQVTFCTWSTSCFSVYGGADIWMQVQ
jgi:hypothetical protein